MTLDDIVRWSGQTAEDIARWQMLGLLSNADEFDANDLETVGLIVFAARRGVSPDDLAHYCTEQGDWLRAFVR